MTDFTELNTIATQLIARYSTAFVEGISHLSRSQLNSIRAFIGSGLTSLVADQLRQIRHVRTFLSPDDPVLFTDLYVNLHLKDGQFIWRDDDLLLNMHRFGLTVVTGTAGCGKSMLMRYAVSLLSKESKLVPILVELRRYNTFFEGDIFDFIFRMTHAEASVTRDLFIGLLKRGGFVFLLDGFDEVIFDWRGALETQILRFVDRFPSNHYIMTSRPADLTPGWPTFRRLQIQSLSPESAKLLVKKCQFNEEIKESFLKEFDDLNVTHSSFLSNPLLITIMLLLFKDVIRIPTKMNLFYSLAFDVLFFRHDALKSDRYVRQRYTELALDEFRFVFSTFCAITYYENQYTFLLPELMKYLSTAMEYCDRKTSSEDFRRDLVESVAMLQADGLNYTFVHRTFQEFFAAEFLANDAHIDMHSYMDGILSRQTTDTVVTRLLEINKGRFESGWVIPYLKDFIDRADEAIFKDNASVLLKMCFGGLRFFAKDGRLGICSATSHSSDFGLNLIDKMYFTENSIDKYFDMKWDDEIVVRTIVDQKVRMSSDKIYLVAKDIVGRRTNDSFISSASFVCDTEDDNWMIETTLFHLAIERISQLRILCQKLDQESHRKAFKFKSLRRRDIDMTESTDD